VTEDTDLDRLFTHLSDEGRRRPIPDAHPVPEKLSAYLANELSPEEDDALQEHLVGCTLCTDLLLDLQRFLDLPEEDRPREGVADFETAAEWRELRGRMGDGVKDVGGEKIAGPSRIRRVFGSVRVWQGVAAVLAVGILGQALWTRVESAKVSPMVFSELAPAYPTRGGDEEESIELPPGQKNLGLRLSGPDGGCLAYSAKLIQRRGNRIVATEDDMFYQPEKGYLLLVDARDLALGGYRIEISGHPPCKGETLEYKFKIIRKSSLPK
jgi:Putative zinc-finger